MTEACILRILKSYMQKSEVDISWSFNITDAILRAKKIIKKKGAQVPPVIEITSILDVSSEYDVYFTALYAI